MLISLHNKNKKLFLTYTQVNSKIGIPAASKPKRQFLSLLEYIEFIAY